MPPSPLPSATLSPPPLSLADFDYALPPERIAQFPLAERRASRLLGLCGGQLTDRVFADLPGLLRAGDLLVFNDSRVIHARLFGHKASGGRVELLVERLIGPHEALAQIRASHAPGAGARLQFEGGLAAEVVAREGEFFLLRFAGPQSLEEQLERHGHLPLPPYVRRAPDAADEARYQTVYARAKGSVAAPTAGLHFDAAMLAELRARGIRLAWLTLHVGAGTFQPVRCADLASHRMHRERYAIPAETARALSETRAAGGRIVAVGTTSLRALEAAAPGATAPDIVRAGTGETDLFILPGHHFRTADLLITNFHLPRSTLLMLVSAFGGLDALRRAYAHALASGYRFFSYGDAMLIERREPS